MTLETPFNINAVCKKLVKDELLGPNDGNPPGKEGFFDLTKSM